MSSKQSNSQFVYEVIRDLKQYAHYSPVAVPATLVARATTLLEELSSGGLEVRVVPAEPATGAASPVAPADDVADALEPLRTVATGLSDLLSTYSYLPDEVVSELEYALTVMLRAQRLCRIAERRQS